MSWVTDFLLVFSVSERYDECGFEQAEVRALANINQWLKVNNNEALQPLDQNVMGGRGRQTCVYGGVFNDVQTDEFVEMVRSQPWQYPAQVQLLIQNIEDECFILYSVLSYT